MSKDLRDSIDFVLDSGKPAKWLTVADQQIQMFKRVSDNYILPAAYAPIKPLVEHYASDMLGYAKLCKAVSDTLAGNDPDFRPVYELYRLVYMRYHQAEIADRTARMRAQLASLRPGTDTKTLDRWISQLRKYYSLNRQRLLKDHRVKTATGHLTSAEREALLEEYWASVDHDINHGQLPLEELR